MDPKTKKVPYRPNYPGFTERPNPLEPHATSEKHALNGTAKTKKHFLRLLLDDDVGASSPRPSKRRKPGEVSSLDLPRLPVVERHGAQRLRIPPTLSGLHQPPPDAGLLPSMLIEQPMNLVEKPDAAKAATSQPPPEPDANALDVHKQGGPKSSRKHKKWSETETADLLKGVARFGIGKWTLILNCSDFTFHGRTALDLKDRFRVCCPDEYRQGRSVKSVTTTESCEAKTSEDTPAVQRRSRPKRSNRVSTVELEKLGIDAPFEKSKRRQRTEWSVKEDDALLAGFKIHNNSWAAIRDDHPALKSRTTTDLRDRLRTRYPEEYAKAGLTVRLARKEQRNDSSENRKQDIPTEKETTNASAPTRTSDSAAGKDHTQPTQAPLKKQLPPTSILHSNDVFWGAPFEPESSESEPITLDRGILDWPYDQRRAAVNNDASSKGASIDPLTTLNLPRPTATSSGNGTVLVHATQQPSLSTASANPLPSLATITAVADADPFTEPLELPSLMGAFGSLETDGRSGGHFMSMEELLS